MPVEYVKKEIAKFVEPWVSNWILFPSMIEAFILDITGNATGKFFLKI